MSGRGHAPDQTYAKCARGGSPPRERKQNIGKTRSRTTAKGEPTGAGRGEGRPPTRARAAADPNGKGGSRNWPKGNAGKTQRNIIPRGSGSHNARFKKINRQNAPIYLSTLKGVPEKKMPRVHLI